MENTDSAKENFQTHNSQKKSEEKAKSHAEGWGKYLNTIPFESLMMNYRKNMDMAKEAQQSAGELVRELSRINHKYTKNLFDGFMAQSRTCMEKTQSSDPLKTSEMLTAAKEHVDQSVEHIKQVADLFSSTTSKVFDSYRHRFQENVKEAEQMMHRRPHSTQ